MQTKKISHKGPMADKISLGISRISSIVKRTLGPGGLPIMIERVGQALDGSPLGPMITKDGVTVADECFDPDPETDLVIQAVKSICRKTNKVAGDGTTTAIALGEALFQESYEFLSQSNYNPQLLREEVEEAASEAKDILVSQAREVNDPGRIEEVATISANGDREVGQIIREAFEKVGSEGVITVDEGHSNDITIDIVEGFQINRGAEAQDRFFNNQEKTAFVAENCHVILFNGPLRNYTDILPAFTTIEKEVLENTGEGERPQFPPVLVVADEFSQEVIQFLLIQKQQAGANVCAVRSPHMSTVRTQMMDDMAVMLGGYRLGNGNRSLGSITYEDIGLAEKVVVSKYKATFYDGAGEEEEILDRIEQLKAQKEAAESPYDASVISDRISSLGQGIAKIGVGGATEMEIKEKYHRIEDALNSSRAAVSEGIIPGGGTTLLKVAKFLEESDSPETAGKKVLRKSLKVPFHQIVENIGQSPEEVEQEVQKALKEDTEFSVYDAREKKVVNAFEAGIIDPVKVTRSALENAVSISALLSTCGGGIVYTRDNN